MSAYHNPTDAQPSGSIVERAMAVLEQERPARHSSPTASPFDASSLGLGDIEKRVEQVRNQIQDLVDTLTQLGEKLPRVGRTGTPLPLAAVAPLPLAEPSPLAAPSPSSVRLDGANLPVLRSATAPVGEIARTALGVVNGLTAPATVALRSTSLVNDLGDEIPGNSVSFLPTAFSVPPGAETPVQVAVQVPANARPGSYRGLIQAVGLAATRAVMLVDVVAPRGAP
jgi:hypothetical protein